MRDAASTPLVARLPAAGRLGAGLAHCGQPGAIGGVALRAAAPVAGVVVATERVGEQSPQRRVRRGEPLALGAPAFRVEFCLVALVANAVEVVDGHGVAPGGLPAGGGLGLGWPEVLRRQ